MRTRKRILWLLAIVLGVCLIGAELFVLVPSIRLKVVVLADRFGASETLVEFLADEDRDVKNEAYMRLIARGPNSVLALLHGLENDELRVRKYSAAILG